jgi:outer membrane lipoprotein-sorting protein
MMKLSYKLRIFVMLVVTGLTTAVGVSAQVIQEQGDPTLTAPVEPLRSGITEEHMFAEMAAHNELRSATLLDYSAHRTYQVVDPKGKVHAEESGRMEYHAPDKKSFVVASEKGSRLVRHLALNPLIASEIDAAGGKQHHDSSITPANYSLHLLGEQQVGPYHCFVAQAVPKRLDKYLFEGTIWIDIQDFAIVRIAGHPAKKLSFWIERADFVREYQKIDEFWLPRRDETFVQVRLYGKKILTIDHQDYTVNGIDNKLVNADVAGSF